MPYDPSRESFHDIKKEKDKVRRTIGIVFQDPSIDDELTAYENIDLHGRLYRVSSRIRKKKIPALLSLVGLADRSQDLVKTFSGGMRRRLEIARGLCFQNTSSINRFQGQIGNGLLLIERIKRLNCPEMASRALILGLKTAGADSCGVSVDRIAHRYNVCLSEDADCFLAALSGIGVIQFRQGILSFTRDGSFFVENIIGRMIGLDLFHIS